MLVFVWTAGKSHDCEAGVNLLWNKSYKSLRVGKGVSGTPTASITGAKK